MLCIFLPTKHALPSGDQVIAQRGRTPCRCPLFARVARGAYIFVDSTRTGMTRHASNTDLVARARAFTFFDCEYRDPTSQMRPQVLQNDFYAELQARHQL